MRYLLYSAFDNIKLQTKEVETQTSLPNIQLNPDEAQVYMVGVMVTLHVARLCVTRTCPYIFRCSQLVIFSSHILRC